MTMRFLESGPRHAVGTVGGVFLLHVKDQLSAREIAQVRALLTRTPGLTGYLQTFETTERVPEVGAEERAAWVELAERAKAACKAGALVVLREGFGGAALRAAISGVMLLAKGKSPVRVFGNLEEGVSWLAAQQATGGVASVELVRAEQELGRRLATP